MVAPPGDLDESAIRVFLASAHQGVNYHPGTWHHYCLALNEVSDFLVVDRIANDENCDEVDLKESIEIEGSFRMKFLPAFLISYSDSSFTNPHEVVLPDEPAECTGNFTHMGAKYWGFETSRHLPLSRTETGFRFAHNLTHEFLIGLTHRSVVEEIHVSTKWFTGNQVPYISIELIDDESLKL